MKSKRLLLVSFAAAILSSSSHAAAQGTGTKTGPAAPAKGGTTASSATGAIGEKAALSKNDLRRLFENTRWDRTSPGKNPGIAIFLRDGKLTWTGFGGLGFGTRYSLEAPDILKVYQKVPKGSSDERNPPFKLFRVNVAAMTATQDNDASTSPGNLTLKYVGPAPK